MLTCHDMSSIFIWAYSKRSCNCLCRMIALRTCLRVPYAITCLAYAEDFCRRGLTRSLRRIIRYCPHRNCLREPFVASFPFILAFCAFHNNVNVWFVLLRGQCLLPPYFQERGGPMAGAISCLRGAYRGAYANFTSTILLETSQFIILWMVHSWSCHSCLHPLSSNLVASYPTYLTLREKPYATC